MFLFLAVIKLLPAENLDLFHLLILLFIDLLQDASDHFIVEKAGDEEEKSGKDVEEIETS